MRWVVACGEGEEGGEGGERGEGEGAGWMIGEGGREGSRWRCCCVRRVAVHVGVGVWGESGRGLTGREVREVGQVLRMSWCACAPAESAPATRRSTWAERP